MLKNWQQQGERGSASFEVLPETNVNTVTMKVVKAEEKLAHHERIAIFETLLSNNSSHPRLVNDSFSFSNGGNPVLAAGDTGLERRTVTSVREVGRANLHGGLVPPQAVSFGCSPCDS